MNVDYRHKLDCGCWFCFSADGSLIRIERCELHRRPQKRSEDEYGQT
jgi:hypothetical protein